MIGKIFNKKKWKISKFIIINLKCNCVFSLKKVTNDYIKEISLI